jgi:predicted HTH domain antitoxin
MKTLVLEIPDSVDLNEQEAKTMLAARLYEKGSLSLGQAADLAGYSKGIFMTLLADFKVSVFNYSGTDLENDILNAKRGHI